jgi:hypothetical protein
MMMVMMMMTVRSWADPDVNSGTMVMMVMMVVSDHNLSGLDTAILRQPFIIGFQKWQGVRNGIEKVSISTSLREFRTPRWRRLGGAHRA